ncbi:MAG: hypothetical protein M0C28_13665 [Candidatus Moduliflexus flocculans]|nr:hypothetical protein [Candidatus Moduliflexus flocculans]
MEIALRLAGYGNLEMYQPDPKLYWRLKPNQNCFTKIDRKPVHINAHGTRGPGFSAAKPPDTLRILSLGDSRTFGWGLSEAETYSAVLGRLLRERLGTAKRVEVINAGVNAWSFQQMHAFYRDQAQAWTPDVVILADANLWTQFSEKNSRAICPAVLGARALEESAPSVCNLPLRRGGEAEGLLRPVSAEVRLLWTRRRIALSRNSNRRSGCGIPRGHCGRL